GQFGAAVFGASAGDVVNVMSPNGDTMVMAQIETITHDDPAHAGPQVEQLRQTIQQTLGQSMIETLAAEAKVRARVRINNDVVQRNFSATEQGQDQGQQ